VSTPFADVLIVGCAPGNRHVVMPAEKAGKRVRNSWNAAAPLKNCRVTASATRGRVFGDSRVVDFVAQEHARDWSPRDWPDGSHDGWRWRFHN